ncbi:MAG: hypothetical protein JXR77_09270 [Lentisphaeria bacterium]|nr:hypothetical protein [Lentisphaeria bacterium]
MQPTPEQTEYRPASSVLTLKAAVLGLVALLWFAVYVGLRFVRGDTVYFREVFPVHLLLAAAIGLYGVYLVCAMFRTLAHGYRVLRSRDGLEIHGEDRVWRLPWQDIRRVRFGDLYLKLDTAAGLVEVPFIRREDQREIYRCHHRAVGLQPDEGRFLPGRRTGTGSRGQSSR